MAPMWAQQKKKNCKSYFHAYLLTCKFYKQQSTNSYIQKKNKVLIVGKHFVGF